MRLTSIVLAALLVSATVSELDAQRRSPRTRLRAQKPARGFAGGGLTVGQGLGAFGDSVGAAVGGAGHFLYRLDSRGIVALRLEGGALIYAHERRRVPWGGTVGGRIQLDLDTSNEVFWFGGGLQLGAPGNGLRPYAAATIGISDFQTSSTLSGSNEEIEFGRTTNYRDAWKVVHAGTAGLYIPLRRGARPVLLDVGAHYMHNGWRQWLKNGSIQDNPDNTITVSPIATEANLMTYRIGITAGVF